MRYPETSIDGQVCFHGRLFADAVEPLEYISRFLGALIGIHGYQTAANSSLGLPCGLYQFMSHSDRHGIVA